MGKYMGAYGYLTVNTHASGGTYYVPISEIISRPFRNAD